MILLGKYYFFLKFRFVDVTKMCVNIPLLPNSEIVADLSGDNADNNVDIENNQLIGLTDITQPLNFTDITEPQDRERIFNIFYGSQRIDQAPFTVGIVSHPVTNPVQPIYPLSIEEQLNRLQQLADEINNELHTQELHIPQEETIPLHREYDISYIMRECSCSRDDAIRALQRNNYNVVDAILYLTP